MHTGHSSSEPLANTNRNFPIRRSRSSAGVAAAPADKIFDQFTCEKEVNLGIRTYQPKKSLKIFTLHIKWPQGSETILYPGLRMLLPIDLDGSSTVEASSGWPIHRRNSSRLSLQLHIYTQKQLRQLQETAAVHSKNDHQTSLIHLTYVYQQL